MTSHGFISFHIVDESPWPLYLSLGSFSCMSWLIEYFTLFSFNMLKLAVVLTFTLLSFFGWTRDISNEGSYLGSHSTLVQTGLKIGFVLFITSEIMFFVSFFWGLFYFGVSPSINIGGWPPLGVQSINPLGIPLLGTMLLMSSGVSVTWSHYSMMAGHKFQTLMALLVTLFMGLSFTVLQMTEYTEGSFSMSDSVYGSIFYMATGFHGIHVLIGSLFLLVSLVRIDSNILSKLHHVGFEFSIWYWHFVDVVWLFLYIFLYWWSC